LTSQRGKVIAAGQDGVPPGWYHTAPVSRCTSQCEAMGAQQTSAVVIFIFQRADQAPDPVSMPRCDAGYQCLLGRRIPAVLGCVVATSALARFRSRMQKLPQCYNTSNAIHQATTQYLIHWIHTYIHTFNLKAISVPLSLDIRQQKRKPPEKI